MVMSHGTKCFLQTQHLSWMCFFPVIMWCHSHTEVVTNRKLDRPGAKATLQQVRSQHALSLLVRLCHLLQGQDDDRIMWLTSVTKDITVKWCSDVRKRRRCKSLLMLTCAASSNVEQLEQLNCICPFADNITFNVSGSFGKLWETLDRGVGGAAEVTLASL